jgi:5-methylcytosine-specific restriction endonuclease McrA
VSVLALDISGIPRQWISYDDAISYWATNSVAWSIGEIVARYRGGVQNDGTLSYIETPSIIAIKGHGFDPNKHAQVALTNKTLFGRDRHICAYCGGHFPNYHYLSRDHIVPRSRGGENAWMNVVTSCKECNSRKGNKTLKEAGLQLLYVPYVPSHHENLLLQHRNILADQMDYLKSGIPKHSRVWLS